MKPERILFPIDVQRCPLDIFPLVNSLASRPGFSVTLLHVVTLNILPLESRIYDELVTEAHWFLDRLAREHLPAATSARTRVRVGNAADEILAEVKDWNADLMILPSCGPSFWRRLTFLWKQPLHPMIPPQMAKVLRGANCGLFIASTTTRFDCEREWGRPPKAPPIAPKGKLDKLPEVTATKPARAIYAQRQAQRRFRFKHA